MFGKTEGKNFSALSRPDSDRRARATVFPNIVLLSSERSLLSQNLSRRVCRSSVDNVPRFIPLIALPFLYSPVVGNSGNEYLWTTCGLAPVYGYRRYKAREREGERGVFYSGWKERILSSVGYRLGFRLGVRTRRKGVGRWRWPSFALLLEENVDGEWTFGRKIPLCRPLE